MREIRVILLNTQNGMLGWLNGQARICTKLTSMKEKVLPRVDHGYQSFDANSGFWQIPLSTESRHLTTFINPFGRYRFNRLPVVLEEPKRLSSGLT